MTTAIGAMAVPSRMIPTPVHAAVLCPWSSCCSSMASSLGPIVPVATPVRRRPSVILSGLGPGASRRVGSRPSTELVPRACGLCPGARSPASCAPLVAGRETGPGPARHRGDNGPADEDARRRRPQPSPIRSSTPVASGAVVRASSRGDSASATASTGPQRDEQRHGQRAERPPARGRPPRQPG